MPFDYVITVCDRARETCPRWPGSTRLIHWSFVDPAAVADSDTRRLVFRLVRDEIAAAIRQFLVDREKQGS
jgi:arsenate reductase